MKRKFLAWLMTFAMVFNMAIPYAAFAEDMPVDTDASYSADEFGATNNDDNATDVGGNSTADLPAGDDVQDDNQGDEPQVDQPATGADDDAESDGKESDGPAQGDNPVVDNPVVDGDGQTNPPVDDNPTVDEPDDDQPADDQPSADVVAGLLGAFAAQVVNEGIMPVADGTTLELKGINQMQVAGLKLYAYSNGAKTGNDLLADKTPADNKYAAFAIEPGTYWLEGYDSDNTLNGGISITVAEGANSFTVSRAYDICVTTWFYDENKNNEYRKFEYGEDYTYDIVITDSQGNARTVAGGTTTYSGGSRSCIFIVGDTIKVTFRAIGTTAEKFPQANVQTVTPTAQTGAISIRGQLLEAFKLTVTAPAGSTISAGRLYQYYTYEFSEPFDVADDGSQASFYVSRVHGYEYGNSDMHFVRVQHPDGVTAWKFGIWNGATVDVTADDLNIGSTKYTKKTVTRDFSDNVFDIGNIYLSVNEQGYLNMNKGATKQINVWRNWQAKDTYWPTQVALPDVHYQVFKVNDDGSITEDTGNSVIKIVENENHSSQATISAVNNGTAVVLVTYDAVTHPDAMADVGTEKVTFSAIWPENTGLFVVNVGGRNLPSNMKLPNIKTGGTMNLDSELDVLFYTGDDGAEYSFTPQKINNATYAASVSRATVSNGVMTMGNFTTDGVTKAEDGSFTITGLTSGRHIIKLERTLSGTTLTTYQVVTTRQADYTVTHKDKTPVTVDNPAQPGETVTIQYSGLFNPMEHLAGVYNNAPGIWVADKYGNTANNDISMLGGYYDFSSNSGRQKLSVTIPTYITDDTYALDGTLHLFGFGNKKGGHRSHSYSSAQGNSGGGGNSPQSDEVLTRLPQVVIPVTPAEAKEVKLIFKDNKGNTYTKDQLTSIVIKGSSGERDYGSDLLADGTMNGVVDQYTYAISGTGIKYSTGKFVIDGSRTEIEIALTASSPNAWDGVALTEPKQVDGVYQISTGAEMAWLGDQLMSAKTLSAKLTADIDLAEYTWNNYYKSYGLYDTWPTVVLDGAGYTVKGLNAINGLFGNLGDGSKISNLTVQGVVNDTGMKSTFGAAGFVGNAKGITIENCKNEAAITNSNGYYAGGIVGNVTIYKTPSAITGCVNTGAVVGNAAGGIVANANGTCLTVDSCYNTGSVTANSDCGGIVGKVVGQSADKNVVIKNCYNTGAAGKAIAGNAGTHTTFSECVYLDTLECSDVNGYAVSAELLKGFAPADSQLKLPCTGGNPVVAWELSGKAHSHGADGVVTANTCTTNGYTTYKCTECQQDYKTDLTYALGHEITDKVVDDYPAYSMNECKRYADCQHKMQHWKNENFRYMTISESGLTNLALTTTGTGNGTWAYDLQTKKFTAGKSSTESQTVEFTFTVDKAAVFGFTYGYVLAYSAPSGDGMEFTITKQGAEDPVLSENLIGVSSDKIFRKTLDAGTYTLKAEYKYVQEQQSGFSGPYWPYNSEYGYLGNIELTAYDTTTDADASLTLFNQAQPVVEQIAALPAVDKIALTDKAAVEAARAAYTALAEGAKAFVSNLSTLEKLEAQLKKLQTEADNSSSAAKGIYVTFRLIGSTLADEDVDLSEGLSGFHGAEYKTWIKTTTYKIESGDVVADVFEKALNEHNLTYKGGRNWVSAISAPEVLGGYMLYERQNGASSGWMYTVNGVHVDKTMDQQTLKNGDKIIFHYINDYNYEDDQWYGGSEGNNSTFQLWLKAPDVDPNGGSSGGGGGATVSTEVNPVIVPDANGEAKVTLTNAEVKVIITEAKDAGANEIVVAPKISGDADTVTVNIPSASAKSIAKDATADLRVKTGLADVVIGTDDLAKLGNSGNLTVSASKQDDGSVKIAVTANGNTIKLADSSVTIPAENAGATDVLVIVKADGTEEIIKKSVAGENGVTALISGGCTIKLVSLDVNFVDVKAHWGKYAAEFVAARGIFNGTAANTFAPNDKMNRAMVATVLYRLENEPVTTGKYTFKDGVDDWAKNAVIWAAEQEIVGGDEQGNYNGNAAVTRQELAAMLYRYAKATGLNTSASGSLNSFSDSAAVADWAGEAMRWAVGASLIRGNADGTINPNGTATRAEVATVIMRLIEMSVK